MLGDDNLLFYDGRSDKCRIQALYADSETNGDPIDPNPFDLTGLSCSAVGCTAPESLVNANAFAHDSARLEFTKTGIFFRTVGRADAAYLVGIRSDDELISIEGNTINDIGDLAEALVDPARLNECDGKAQGLERRQCDCPEVCSELATWEPESCEEVMAEYLKCQRELTCEEIAARADAIEAGEPAGEHPCYDESLAAAAGAN